MAWTPFGIQDRSNATPVSAAYIESFGEHVYDQAIADAGGASELRVVTPEQFGGAGDNSTDNTLAIRQCVDSLLVGGGTVKFGAGTYLIGSGVGLDTSRQGNSLIALPLGSESSLVAGGIGTWRIVFEGAGSGHTTIRCARITDTYSATNGPPTIIGGTTWEWEESQLPPVAHTIQDCAVTIRGIDFNVASDTNTGTYGPHIGVLHAGQCASATIEDSQMYTTPRLSQPMNKWNFGVRLPRRGNSGRIRVTDARIFGFYANCVFSTPHVQFDQLTCSYGTIGFAMEDQMFSLDNHSVSGKYMSVGDNSYHFAGWDPVNGAKSLTDSPNRKFYFAILNLDIEDGNNSVPPVVTGGATGVWPETTSHFLDGTNRCFGVINYNRTLGGVGGQRGLTGGPGLILGGASNLAFRELPAGGVYTRDSQYVVNTDSDLVAGVVQELPPQLEYINLTGNGTITDMTPGVAYGEKHVLKANANNITITRGGIMKMSEASWGGATSQWDSITFRWDGAVWVETGRCEGVV